MILVDTSVWVAHFRERDDRLALLLDNGQVFCHPFIVGELACGNLKQRPEILSLLRALPSAVVAEHNEVIDLIENQSLMGKGLGFVDVHLIASALMSRVNLWTFDRKMNQFVTLLGIAH
jgi:predicted nucleic acid-binding protein